MARSMFSVVWLDHNEGHVVRKAHVGGFCQQSHPQKAVLKIFHRSGQAPNLMEHRMYVPFRADLFRRDYNGSLRQVRPLVLPQVLWHAKPCHGTVKQTPRDRVEVIFHGEGDQYTQM